MPEQTIDRALVFRRFAACLELLGTVGAIVGEIPEDVWREAVGIAVGEGMSAGQMSAELDDAVDMMSEVRDAVAEHWPEAVG